uniref:Uncharacterized protein n=1 Tax=Amphimedon queenslandica TaxID=400682 RepID=A0A1X7TML6_AMPQE
MADFWRKDRLNNLLFYPAILAVRTTLSCHIIVVITRSRLFMYLLILYMILTVYTQ